jgi:uncharacterized membrane protein (UPF0127 family)
MAAGFEFPSLSATRSRPGMVRLKTRRLDFPFAHVKIARTFSSRLVGLLSRSALPADEGLLLVPGGSVHTLGMRFAIDIVFLDAQLVVLGVVAHMRPWRFAWAPRSTCYVLELPAGRARAAGLDRGEAIATYANRRTPP